MKIWGKKKKEKKSEKTGQRRIFQIINSKQIFAGGGGTIGLFFFATEKIILSFVGMIKLQNIYIKKIPEEN